MTLVVLLVLCVADLGLLAAVFVLSRRQVAYGNSLLEMTEERRLLEELRDGVRAELASAQEQNRQAVEKVGRLALEAEQEVKTGATVMQQSLDTVVAELRGGLEQSLAEVSQHAETLEKLVRQAGRQRLALQRLVQRAERLCRFFDKNVPYEEILDELEDKKYADARALIARGVSAQEIAQELGLTESEVRLIGASPAA